MWNNGLLNTRLFAGKVPFHPCASDYRVGLLRDMNRREFIEYLLAGTAAAVLPGGADCRAAIDSPVSINNQINGASYPRRFAYAISGDLSNKLGERSNQAELARFDAVILNIYARSDIRYSKKTWQDVVARIRALNPNILLGAYVIIEETKNDPNRNSNVDIDKYIKVQHENWWLYTGTGAIVQSYGDNCAINGSRYSTPDAAGLRWPQWLAKRDFDKFFNPALISGKGFDIWFVDNIRDKSLYRGDCDKDGYDDPPSGAKALSAYRGMNADYFTAMRALAPHLILMGNAPCDLGEYPMALDASLNEAIFGAAWSLGGHPPWGWWHDGSWTKAMEQYNTQFKNVHTDLVVFQAQGLPTDYQLFRFSLCSCLLNNGYFNYTDKSVGYVVPPWFDEYDYKLGMPISDPQTRAWSNGVWRRDFQYGTSLVNPTTSAQIVTIEAGYHRIIGSQDPTTNNGVSATGAITIPSRDGIILRRD